MPQRNSTKLGSQIGSTILGCLDQALSNYGESVKEVIYWNFEKSFGESRDKIAENPEKFMLVIEKIFGGGSFIVENAIVTQISLLPGLEKLEDKNLITALKAAYDILNLSKA